jgi:FkbM family methyltransferase
MAIQLPMVKSYLPVSLQWYLFRNRKLSFSQLRQDLFFAWILERIVGKNNGGFFVEFGATNGVTFSNTLYFENSGWAGLLVEPGKIWHSELVSNRNCLIDFRCVSNESNKLVEFNETQAPELSTIAVYSDQDHHSSLRKEGKHYQVDTVSLLDLLREHQCPAFISYLSIDTEGSELDILESFDFSAYSIGIMSIEHNYTQNRDKIQKLMESAGFTRILQNHSKWDDWYLNNDLLFLLKKRIRRKLGAD